MSSYIKRFLLKLLIASVLGFAASIYGEVKFGFKCLPFFVWASAFFAFVLIVVIPLLQWQMRRLKRLNNYTVLDIETTGIKPQDSEITELAALRIRHGKIVAQFQELVAIRGEIPDVVVEKTHITKEMLSQARSEKKVLKDFFRFVGKDLLVGYNLDYFDIPFINYYSSKELKKELRNPTVDVWKLAKERCPGLGSYKLDALRSVYGINELGSHRALKDCEDTNKIYRILLSGKCAVHSKPKTTSGLKLKSIYRMTDSDLQDRYGDNWCIASEIVHGKKKMVLDGLDQDWDRVRGTWDKAARATAGQISMLSGLGVDSPSQFSKIEASLMIDELMLEADVKREVMRREQKAKKEADRAMRIAAREERKLEMESKRAATAVARARRKEECAAKKVAREAELKHYDGPRMKISQECAEKWRNEFTSKWNLMLADDAIEVSEIIELKSWLNRHKRRRDDYYRMIKTIDQIAEKGIVDDESSQNLYDAAVEVLDALSIDETM